MTQSPRLTSQSTSFIYIIALSLSPHSSEGTKLLALLWRWRNQDTRAPRAGFWLLFIHKRSKEGKNPSPLPRPAISELDSGGENPNKNCSWRHTRPSSCSQRQLQELCPDCASLIQLFQLLQLLRYYSCLLQQESLSPTQTKSQHHAQCKRPRRSC